MINCRECTYHKQSSRGFIETNFITGRGNKNADVMIIFDSPFINDLQSQSIASSKEYNDYLNNYLEKIGLSLDDTYVTCFCKCFISDKSKKPTKVMKKKCFDLYLDNEIRTVKPKAIIIIGKMITQWLIPAVNNRFPLKQVVGQKFYNPEYDCNIIPIYDMFYLANFTSRSSQIRQTSLGFARVKSVLEQESEAVNKKLTYSSDVKVLKTFGEYVVCDLETSGLDYFEDEIVTVGLMDLKTQKIFSIDAEDYDTFDICDCNNGLKTVDDKEVICEKCKGQGKLFKVNYKSNEFYSKILPQIYCELKTRKLILHNAEFDLEFFLAKKFNLCDNLVADTRLMQFLVNPLGGTSLGFLIQLYFGIAYKETIVRKTILNMKVEDRKHYCGEDVYYTGRLFVKLHKVLKEQDSLRSNKILTGMIKIISSDLIFTGIKIDENKVFELIEFYQAEKDMCEVKFKKRFKLEDTFSLNSPKQLGKLLYEDLKLPVSILTDKGNPSCNVEAINKLASKRPALKGLLDYRTVKGHIEKLKGYQKATKSDGRIHGNFNLFSPDSSRLMSSKPNIQNVPRNSRIKEIFVAREGYSFVYYDYSQIEFRVWLHLANDKRGIDFVNNGRDIHALIASQHYKEAEENFLDKSNKENQEKRNMVKAIVYGSMYGRSPEGIVAAHGGSKEEATQIQMMFFNLCREGWMWLKQIEQKVFKDKKLFTPFGTVRLFPDIELIQGRQRDEIVRQAKSFIVQSWAVEMVFIGMCKVWRKIREDNLDAKYVHQIHDAGILEVKDCDIEKVKEIILRDAQSPYAKLKVPLKVDLKIGKTWAEIA